MEADVTFWPWLCRCPVKSLWPKTATGEDVDVRVVTEPYLSTLLKFTSARYLTRKRKRRKRTWVRASLQGQAWKRDKAQVAVGGIGSDRVGLRPEGEVRRWRPLCEGTKKKEHETAEGQTKAPEPLLLCRSHP